MKKPGVFICLIIVGVIGLCVFLQGNKLDRAREAYKEGDYETAIELCENFSDSGEAWMIQGNSYTDLGLGGNAIPCYANAIQCLDKQLEYDDKDVETYLMLIEAYEKLGYYDNAAGVKQQGFSLTGDERLNPNVVD